MVTQSDEAPAEEDHLGPNCYYDKSKSFFDNISSELKTRSEGGVRGGGPGELVGKHTLPQFLGLGCTILLITQLSGLGPTHMSATVDTSVPVVAAWEALAVTGPEPLSHFPPGFSALPIEAGLAPHPS